MNLQEYSERALLSGRILSAIDAHAQDIYDDGHRKHLGASIIGEACKRKLWYTFRWVGYEKFSGRMLRLFNRGHLEELRNNAWLRGIGATVWDYDYNAPKKADGSYPQITISGVNGHFGGSCDGVVQLPPVFGVPFPMLQEFKTNGTGKGFNDVRNEGVEKAKVNHWAQQCVYGYKLGLDYSLYWNTNKNDDDIHMEVVKLDHKLGAHMEAKAELIITSQEAPARLSDNPTNFLCKFCNFSKVCHQGDVPLTNCRSCAYARPIENKQWFCDKHNGTPPDDVIKTGCGDHVPVTNNVR